MLQLLEVKLILTVQIPLTICFPGFNEIVVWEAGLAFSGKVGPKQFGPNCSLSPRRLNFKHENMPQTYVVICQTAFPDPASMYETQKCQYPSRQSTKKFWNIISQSNPTQRNALCIRLSLSDISYLKLQHSISLLVPDNVPPPWRVKLSHHLIIPPVWKVNNWGPCYTSQNNRSICQLTSPDVLLKGKDSKKERGKLWSFAHWCLFCH